jgi:hypothetical protein
MKIVTEYGDKQIKTMYRIRIEKMEDDYWKEENFSKQITTERMVTTEMVKDSMIGDEKEVLTYIFGRMYDELKHFENER